MNDQLRIAFSIDLTAYANTNVPADTDLSPENLRNLARKVFEGHGLDPNQVSENSPRVVAIWDSRGNLLKAGIPLGRSHYDAGIALQAFLHGHTSVHELLHEAIYSQIISPEEAKDFLSRWKNEQC